MNCGHCGHQPPAGSIFCNGCGTKLVTLCASCGATPPPGSRFCNGCGASLVASAPVPVISSQPPNPDSRSPVSYTPPHLAERIRVAVVTDGERKTITALFADLKGSTALIDGLDPEEAREVIDPALQLMMDAVHRYEGYVAQALGDGIFALFGAPLAHEDHPQRALYAALRMQDEMRRYSDTLRAKGSPPLLMRVGVNTGEVVVRSIRKDDLHTDYVPVGHSTNLAARMEQLAAPGSILVTAYTHTLTDGYFEFKKLGQTQIKGVEAPLHVYEVLGTGPLRTRLQVAARRGLTRFVGRQSEMEQLQQVLAQAKAGHGQIVGVMGEPGLGKSRLFYEFKLTSLAGCLVLEAYSVSHGKASAYLPVIELLKSYFDIKAEDDERKRREKVTGKVLTLDRGLEDSLPYVFALLGIEEQPSPLQQMDPQIRRRRTFEALKRLFFCESLKQPLILIFEDLHWIDSETQGFLDVLSESVASAKVLLLVNYRPEYRHEWGSRTYYTQLRLVPFGKAEAEEFLAVLLGESQSPLPVGERARVRGTEENFPALKQLILDKTEGTPFFMEEIVQELMEQGVLVRDAVRAQRAVPLPTDLHIPPTVQGVLAARIDRLAADEKALLQQLAVIGREFPVDLLRQVIPQPEEELYRLLASLQHKEFLYEQPAFPEPDYIFKHALTQEVAYGTVLQERRKALHERTAQAIETLYQDRLAEHYRDLAHHYSRSGNTEKATEYLQQAGQQAGQRSANTEAISHFTAALELLKTLPDSLGRAQRELTLQLALGPPLIAIKGPGAPEVEAVYTRARRLGQQVGEPAQLFSVLRGFWQVQTARAELKTARELGEQLFSLAQRTQDSTLLLEAHHTLGGALYFLGECASAREHLEQGLALYDPQQHRSLAALYGHDPRVGCLSRLSRVLWSLGYPDQAIQKSREALALAQEVSHLESLTFALFHAGLLCYLRREGQAAQGQAEALIALSREHGLTFYRATGIMMQGLVFAEQGREEEGIAQMRQGLSSLQAGGTGITLPTWACPLAEAYGKVGQLEEGFTLLAEALAVMDKSGGQLNEAEVWRIKGELALRAGEKAKGRKGEEVNLLDPTTQIPNSESEAEECFRRAIEIAKRQQAKSLELRAVMSLARLWQSQGKQREAHQMLSEIYHWFTEGFDTKDLQEAKVLLEELA